MTELEKFADSLPSRQVLREFFEWCDGQKIELGVPRTEGLAPAATSGRWALVPLTEDRERMLDRYFGVDATRLEDERRSLLKLHSSSTYNPKGKP